MRVKGGLGKRMVREQGKCLENNGRELSSRGISREQGGRSSTGESDLGTGGVRVHGRVI